ncbi:unnamed protein product [Owenia fusiformis]|uniref:Sushi domain-containing protein n=1 Tax=Owenia fusiformis TaxID=6347 RepID=A0A8S4NMN0_OWEFU|nr:unnamed protein product [Owenia fusiformis]
MGVDFIAVLLFICSCYSLVATDEEVFCPFPYDIPHGTFNRDLIAYDGVRPSTRIFYKCDPCFQMIGQNKRFCNKRGHYTSDPPICVDNGKCKDFDKIAIEESEMFRECVMRYSALPEKASKEERKKLYNKCAIAKLVAAKAIRKMDEKTKELEPGVQHDYIPEADNIKQTFQKIRMLFKKHKKLHITENNYQKLDSRIFNIFKYLNNNFI